jgi:hypothetical protein
VVISSQVTPPSVETKHSASDNVTPSKESLTLSTFALPPPVSTKVAPKPPVLPLALISL